jgi:transcription-repair coupling factor (superfamily II helicase)
MPGKTTLAQLFRRILAERSQPWRQVRDALARDSNRTIRLQNLPGAALAMVLEALARDLQRPVLLLTASIERADDAAGDLEFLCAERTLHWPKWELLPYDREELTVELAAKTIDTLLALEDLRANPRRPAIITAPADATMQMVLPREEFARLCVRLEWGQRIPIADLSLALSRAGYDRQPIVEARGEYSIRGNIVDVYPPNADAPLRLDFFGDELEGIRLFDVQTQRSREALDTSAKVTIPPARVKGCLDEHVQAGGKLVPFYDWLPAETLLVLDSPERQADVCEHFENAVDRQYHDVLKASPDLPKPRDLTLDRAGLSRAQGRFRRLEHSELPVETPDRTALRIPFDTRAVTPASRELPDWMAAFRKLREAGSLLAIVCDNDGQAQRLDELLHEFSIPAQVLASEDGLAQASPLDLDVLKGPPDVLVLVGGLSAGFHFPSQLLALVTDREIFGRYRRRHVYRKIYRGRPIASAADILRGDFVVHVEHGIGKFLGMRSQVIDGRQHDLMEILYADDNRLLVPVDKIRHVQKYTGAESGEPALDRLGSGRWQKRRKKNSEQIEKLASELLRLYARREVASRPPYPDHPLYREMEASFLYAETPDQLAAIAAIKSDMEGSRPMDRLLCGDVGFGKTEVALRAIFKCFTAGRQAVFIAPTTILAQQHYRTVTERFADFGVRVGSVSRFRTPREIRETLRKLAAGEVDVVVGTHRLLSEDVRFLDLGLVVVDEEQRFGVKAKEKLKALRSDVDILTLSATPIPRTLHMALSGLRDLSVIATAPMDRQPIKTRIIQFEEDQIAEAILRELNRGGQVYFVHNRITTIGEVERRLQQIVPHARIRHAHGQMDEHELEDVMMSFVEHEFDILVATTIIESGLDIPNCNTIIINRADAFGLSQLYQLRGRVGREKRKAYAYMIVPPGEAITETAVKRLAAIEEFTELGSGFNLAMRDMEIRGAGNLLGAEQHGTISEIGFELYCDMLREAVGRLRGEDIDEDRDVEIKAELSSVIPPQYIPVESQRLNFYKRFAVAREERDLADIEAELRDRYGDLPETVQALLKVSRLRITARPLRIAAVQQQGLRARITFAAPEARAWEPDFDAARRTIDAIGSVRPEGQDVLVVTFKAGSAPIAMVEALTTAIARAEALSKAAEASPDG